MVEKVFCVNCGSYFFDDDSCNCGECVIGENNE